MELKTLNGYGFDATKLGGLDAQYYAQGRAAHNLLDNSWFVNPVNQRGKTSYSASGYTIDMWRTWDDGAVTINNGYISHETPIYQTIAVKLDTSKAYTLAVMNTDNVVTLVSGFINNDLWGSGINLTYDNGNPYVRIYADDHVKNIVWAALYEGSYDVNTLPAYQPKGYAAELAECRIYYKHQVLLPAVKTSGNTYLVSKSFDVPMRAVPTYSFVKADVYGVGTFNDFTECYLSLDGSGVYYALLPTLTSYNNVSLVVNFSCDL